jgi:hypothetical protein
MIKKIRAPGDDQPKRMVLVMRMLRVVTCGL